MKQHTVVTSAEVRVASPSGEDSACRRTEHHQVQQRAEVQVAGPSCEDSACRRMKQILVELVKMLTGKAVIVHLGGRMQIFVKMLPGKAVTAHLGGRMQICV